MYYWAMKKPIVSFDRVYQKTSKALGVSYTSVHRIMNGKRPYPRSMRVRVSLDFDILIEAFISLCIIGTVGAIFRE
jgi:plasmid maintenance system antidote protein VapI